MVGAVPVAEKDKSVVDIVITSEDKNNEIGIKALPLLHDGQVIIISGGTTNLFFQS